MPMTPQESYLDLEQQFYGELEALIQKYRNDGLKDKDVASALNQYVGEFS